MKKLCPNFDREDALDTVLEVPVPEEMLVARPNAWQSVITWMRPHKQPSSIFGGRAAELQLLLGVSGAPLIPLPIREDGVPGRPVIDDPLVRSPVQIFVGYVLFCRRVLEFLLPTIFLVSNLPFAATRFVSSLWQFSVLGLL